MRQIFLFVAQILFVMVQAAPSVRNASGQKPNEFHIFYFIAFDCDIVMRLTCAPLLSSIGQLNVPNIFIVYL